MKRLFRGYRCRKQQRVQRRLAAWFEHEPGQSLADLEQELLDDILANLFGYHLLQLGNAPPRDLLRGSRIRHRMVMVTGRGSNSRTESDVGLFHGEPEALPVESDAVDVVVIPHLLEFSSEPHELLREVERVLIPEGHLIIIGFNPWSLWGLARLLLGWKQLPPWCGRFYTRTRINDWLSLLGFDTLVSRSAFYRPPVSHQGLLAKLAFIERLGHRWWPSLGGIYILVAKKRVATLTPIKPRWRPRRSLLQDKLPEATMRREKL